MDYSALSRQERFFFFSPETWQKAFRRAEMFWFSTAFILLRNIPHVRMKTHGKKPQWEGGSLAGAQVPASKGIITSRQDLSWLQHQKTVAYSHEHSQLQGATEVSVKIIKPLQLVPGKLMMKFQVSLPSIYSLYLRRICCVYKDGDQMIKSNRLFPSLRLLWSLSTHKIEAWFRSPKYLVCHVSFSSKWT